MQITQTTPAKRQSNIELLRIISMMLVLVIHYNVPINGQTTHEMVVTEPWRAVGIASLKSLSFVCVNCFIIISGYFGIRWKWRSLINFLFQISFWGGMVHIITSAAGIGTFSYVQLIKNMTLFLHGVNWFFINYLALYMFAPVLNAFIEKASSRDLGLWVLVFYLFQTVFGYVLKSCGAFNQGLTFVSFIGLYMLGAYLKRTSLQIFHYSAAINLAIYIGVGLLCVAISMVANYLGASKDIYSYMSPLQIIQTIYLFLFCKSLQIRRGEKIILFFSSSAFAGLLAHSWNGALLYGKGLEWIDTHISYPFFLTMLYIMAFFATACLIDKIRIFIWSHTFDRYFSR